MASKDITLTFKTNDGKSIPVKYRIYDGATDFEVWRQQPGNSTGTEEDYQRFIRGPEGDFVVSAKVSEEVYWVEEPEISSFSPPDYVLYVSEDGRKVNMWRNFDQQSIEVSSHDDHPSRCRFDYEANRIFLAIAGRLTIWDLSGEKLFEEVDGRYCSDLHLDRKSKTIYRPTSYPHPGIAGIGGNVSAKTYNGDQIKTIATWPYHYTGNNWSHFVIDDERQIVLVLPHPTNKLYLADISQPVVNIYNSGLRLAEWIWYTQFGVRPSEERIYYCDRWYDGLKCVDYQGNAHSTGIMVPKMSAIFVDERENIYFNDADGVTQVVPAGTLQPQPFIIQIPDVGRMDVQYV